MLRSHQPGGLPRHPSSPLGPVRSRALRGLLGGGLALALAVPLSGEATADPTPTPTPTTSPTASPPVSPSPTATPPAGPLATSLALTRSAGTVTFGTTLTLSGVLTRADGSGVPDAPVQVLARTAGQSSRVVLATVRTGADGRFSLGTSPRTTSEYQLRYGGDALDAPALSNKTVSGVRPRISAAFSPAGVKLGQTSLLSGVVAPAYAGTRLAVRRRAADGSWQEAAVVGIDGSGAYRWSVRPGLVGRYVFQVFLPPHPAHLAAATPALAVVVDPRDLRRGDTGGDVTTLEQRLAAQKAYVGRVDGVFDGDLTHAVLAFQKSQGIARTGVYDSATRVRLGAPAPVRLRHPVSGRAVEIDLSKQVLYLSEGGVVRLMVDVSSGSGRLYEQDGVTHRADTPLGSFAIQRKIDDPNHTSPLGVLYRPAFFYQGWAVHGSSSVPAFPASHGCIRVTNPVQDRLFGLLTLGTPVTIYAK
jgi:N-acetylmuramoyl-L-alanine amidase